MTVLIVSAEADGDLVCEAGVRWVDVNDTLKAKGAHILCKIAPSALIISIGIPLFFPVRLSFLPS